MKINHTTHKQLVNLTKILCRLSRMLCLYILLGVASIASAQTTNYFFDGFETAQSLDDWSADNGTWEIGVPTFGPPTNSLGRRAFSGTNCAATVLGGNYSFGVNSRLISKNIIVPSTNSNPRLRFWHWYSLGGSDKATVEVRVVGSTNWTQISPDYVINGSGVWTRPSINLNSYAGQNIQIGFHLRDIGQSFDFVNPGWYVDEVVIVTGPLTFNNPENWETGLGDWSTENGAWETGVPTSGPGTAHQGTNCVGTVLAGNYAFSIDSRLVSPPFVVPPSTANPQLRFWHWYSVGGSDKAAVEIRVVGATNWSQVSPDYIGNSSGVWSRPAINLSAYGNQKIQIGFRLRDIGQSFDFVAAGWYIDEIRLLHDFTLQLLDSPIVRTQNTACISLGIAASSPASTVNFTVNAPAGNLNSLILNTEACWSGTITPQPNSQWLVSLQNSCSSALAGVQTIGSICFTAVSAESAFVPLSVSDLVVTNQDASLPPAHAFGSRTVIIANEPLLEASLGTNKQRAFTVYGKANTAYEIQRTPNLDTPVTWIPTWTNTVPASLSSTQPITGTFSNSPSLFLRAKER